MRRLRRPCVVPPTLRPDGAAAKKTEEHRRTKELDPEAKLDFGTDYWNRPDVRGALVAMQWEVCAYCNAGLELDRGDVDHFRPKKPSRDGSHRGYWWLAHEFGNYFLTCRGCNEHKKLERFPLEPGASRTEYATRAGLATERRLLVDPEADPIEEWMRVDCLEEDDGCSVCMRPSCSADAMAAQRVTKTIELFRLNEDIRLRRARIRAREEATERYKAYRQEPIEAHMDKLRRLASRFCSQGMTVRAYLEDLTPEIPLPSPDEELRWLLEEIDKLLYCHARIDDPGDACRRHAEELFWALAVLWKDPPTGTPAAVERWLEKTGWRDVVEPMLRQLT